MRKLNITLFFLFILISLNLKSQIRITDRGYFNVPTNGTASKDYSIRLGNTIASDGSIRGNWGLEYWNGGINFYIPWPNSNSGHYKLFLKDNGKIGIGTNSPNFGKLQINGEGNNNGLAIYNGSGTTFRIYRNNNIAFITRGTSNGIRILTQGNVGINKTPSFFYKLDVNGTIRAYNIDIITPFPRIKSNYENIDKDIIKLNKLNSITYYLNAKTNKENNNIEDNNEQIFIEKQPIISKRRRIMFNPEEMKRIFPELVFEDNEGEIGIDYISFIPLLVEAYKKQEIIINELKKEIDILKKNNSTSKNEAIDNININKIKLYQNSPNPFFEKTEISFYLPEDVGNALLYIYDMQGKQLKNEIINQRGYGKKSIMGSELEAGMYIYTLIADGKEIDTKRMVLTK